MLKLDMNKMMEKLSGYGFEFDNERQFEYHLAKIIKEEYEESTVLVEACPIYQVMELDNKYTGRYIDILVIMNKRLYPIELKYVKHKEKPYDGGYTNIRYRFNNYDKNKIIMFKNGVKEFGNGYHFDMGYRIILTDVNYFYDGEYKNYIETTNDCDWQLFDAKKGFKYLIIQQK